MFLQSGPAETTNYLILGYAVIFGVMFLHLASFWVRSRNLRADLAVLEKPTRKAAPRKAAKRKRK